MYILRFAKKADLGNKNPVQFSPNSNTHHYTRGSE